jgi:hypothetical protein
MANPSASGQVAQGTPSAVGSYQFDQDGRLTHLQWANNPHGALNRRHRPKRRPHLLPEKDDTIDRVAAHKEEIVVDMIQAIYSLRTAHDKTDAERRTLFLFGGPDSIPPVDVEATCRYLFDQVLFQCRYGFNGHQNVDQFREGLSSKPKQADRESNCAKRIVDVITALRDWKSICKDVVCSDKKVRNLANAPLTARRLKGDSMRSNDTRGKTQAKGIKARKALKNQGLSATDDGELLATTLMSVKIGKANMATGARKESAAETDNNWPGAYNGPPPPYPGMPQQGFGGSFDLGQGYQALKTKFGLDVPDALAQAIPSGTGLFDKLSEDQDFPEALWQLINPSSRQMPGTTCATTSRPEASLCRLSQTSSSTKLDIMFLPSLCLTPLRAITFPMEPHTSLQHQARHLASAPSLPTIPTRWVPQILTTLVRANPKATATTSNRLHAASLVCQARHTTTGVLSEASTTSLAP